MKKNIYTLFFSLFFVAFSNAQEAPSAEKSTAPNPNASEISFETESHDFGTIKQAANGVYEFKFKNTGKEPLIISNARGSCGCTVPTWTKEPIKQGETGTIKVSYDTKRIGAFSKTVTVLSNAKTSTKTLSIKGVVEAPPKEETMPVRKINEDSPFEKGK